MRVQIWKITNEKEDWKIVFACLFQSFESFLRFLEFSKFGVIACLREGISNLAAPAQWFEFLLIFLIKSVGPGLVPDPDKTHRIGTGLEMSPVFCRDRDRSRPYFGGSGRAGSGPMTRIDTPTPNTLQLEINKLRLLSYSWFFPVVSLISVRFSNLGHSKLAFQLLFPQLLLAVNFSHL